MTIVGEAVRVWTATSSSNYIEVAEKIEERVFHV